MEEVMSENDIEKLAIEELEREAKLAAARAKSIGVRGWQKCPLPHTNKRFLQNMLMSAVTSKPVTKLPRGHSKNPPDPDTSSTRNSTNGQVKKVQPRHLLKDTKLFQSRKGKKPKEPDAVNSSKTNQSSESQVSKHSQELTATLSCTIK